MNDSIYKQPASFFDKSLGDLCSYINRGVSPSYVPTPGIPILNQKCIREGKINLKLVRYTANDKKYTNEKQIELSDILINSTGVGTAGRVAISNVNGLIYVDSHISILRIKDTVADPLFIFYNLFGREKEIETYAEGSTGQVELSRDRIKSIKIKLPKLTLQKKISHLLWVLDEKIDLLSQQNFTLEELVKTYFSDLFSVPQPNEGTSLSDYVDFDPREKINRNKEIQFFDMKTLSSNSMSIADGTSRLVNSASSFRNFDTLLAKITPCLENGKTGFVMNLGIDEVARGSTEFIVMRSKGIVSPYWIYCLARSKSFRDEAIQSMTGTSGRQRVQTSQLKNIKVNFNQEDMRLFHNLCEVLFKKIRENFNQTKTLINMRNILLPKLMNGEIEICD